MTIAEFQAWLDGFNEAIDGEPTPEQWAKIRDKISDLQAVRTPNVPSIPFDWGKKYMTRRIGEPMWTRSDRQKFAYETIC